VSADSASPSSNAAGTDKTTQAARAWRSRRRAVRLWWIAGIAAVLVVAPAAAYGSGAFITHGVKTANIPQSANKLRAGDRFTLKRETGLKAADAGTDYTAYVAAAGGYEVVGVDVATDTVLSPVLDADTPEGVAVTPDGSQVFIAETGQYDVIAANPTTGAETPIYVGPYPQDVAVSPDGSEVYATVTGGNTGPGGSDIVAVISTATDTVTGDIRVGTAPRQVLFSPDGSQAYITTAYGVTVIDTASGTVVGHVRIPAGAQGLAISPDGSTLYVTSPAINSLFVINTSTGQVTGRYAAGQEPYAVAVTPDGSTLYVADLNADEVSVLSAASGALITTVATGRQPASVAVTPDGSQVWVGNILDGDITVIDPATNTVIGTVLQGTGTSNYQSAPLGITFVKS
jgi:YVTN family beta-propeller protein